MATTLTAEALPELAQVRLTITTDEALVSLVRADANGTASVRTRGDDVLGIIPPAGVDIVTLDYEASQGSIVYTATTTSGATAQAGVSFALLQPWIFVPVMPNYSTALQTVTGYNAQVPGRSTIHEPLGKREPTVVIRSMGTKRGTLGLWAGTYDAAEQILATLSRGEVLMLRQAEHRGMDMYFIADDAALDTLAVAGQDTVWGVSVRYVQVARPIGNLATALGWDFAALGSSAATFAELRTRYASFEDMRLNEVTP